MLQGHLIRCRSDKRIALLQQQQVCDVGIFHQQVLFQANHDPCFTGGDLRQPLRRQLTTDSLSIGTATSTVCTSGSGRAT